MDNKASKKIISDLAKSIKDVFKKYSKTIRQKGWNTITSNDGDKQIKKYINDPNYPLSGIESLNFKEWIMSENENIDDIAKKDLEIYINLYKNPQKTIEYWLELEKMDRRISSLISGAAVSSDMYKQLTSNFDIIYKWMLKNDPNLRSNKYKY